MKAEKETWQQALERYNHTLEMVKPKIEPEYQDFYKICFSKKESKERILYNSTIIKITI